MIAKRFGGNVGGVRAAGAGAGTMRRKVKNASRPSAVDDKKLTSSLKRLGLKPIDGIEEVNLFKEDGNVIHFVQPRVQGNVQSNTYVVSGNCDTKPLQALMPGILSQIGSEGMANLKKLAERFQAQGGLEGMAAGAGAAAAAPAGDDDIPDLVENFEEAAKV